MAVLYELLAGAREPRPALRAAATTRSPSRRPVGASGRPHEPVEPLDRRRRSARASCCCATSTCSTRATGIDAPPRRARPRRRRSPSSPSPATLERAGRRGDARGRRASARCCPPSSTRTCTCARPARSTRRTSRPARAPPPPAATAGVIAMPNTDPVLDSGAAAAARCATRPPARRASPSASWPRSPAGLQGEQLTEMAELREAGALGFTDDGKPVVERRDAAQGAAVPAAVRRRARAARGGPDALARRRDARGRRQRRARASPGIPTVAESTMVARDAALGGLRGRRACTSSTSAARRSVRGGRRGQGARRAASAPRSRPTTCC